jgi:serine protease Do
MHQKHGFKLLLLVPLLLLAAIGVFHCTCSFAESDRPTPGSIRFGADKKPLPAAKEDKGYHDVFANVAEKVVPWVVSVVPTKIDTVLFYRNPFYRFFGEEFEGSPFEDFFGGPRGGQNGGNGEPPVEQRERRMQGLGSGVIVSRDGYVLTNYHVVAGATEIEIKLNDGRVFDAEIIGSDSLSDVAVLKIQKSPRNLPVAYLGDSDDLRPGDWVLAVGNPFSLSWSVTAGIVSALGRTVSGSMRYEDYIQTDAAINPGNSGGALVDIEGALIGINTMIYTRTGGSMGIGFAIPINMARRVMEDLIYEGEVNRGWIGVSIQSLDRASREVLGLKATEGGVLISDVFDGQPADNAGMQRGDVVLSIDGSSVTTPNDLRNMVAALEPGQSVSVTVLRDGKRRKLTLEIASRSQAQQARRQQPRKRREPRNGGNGNGHDGGNGGASAQGLGVRVENVTRSTREEFAIPDNVDGVVVVGVNRASSAAQEIAPGDVIRAAKLPGEPQRDINNVQDFKDIIGRLGSGDSVLLLVSRGTNSLFVSLEVD